MTVIDIGFEKVDVTAIHDGRVVNHMGIGSPQPGRRISGGEVFTQRLLKLLKSAAANAENNHQMDPEKLYVSQVFATPGPILKRMMPRARGRAYRINKRTSHITIAVAER